jgi:uncharacterized OB-fold protein
MASATIEMSRCSSCHAGFLPRPGNCPRCGSTRIETVLLPAQATVRAATELSTPASGWTAPHRLALAEIAEGIRILCVVIGPLPTAGDIVQVKQVGPVYQIGG